MTEVAYTSRVRIERLGGPQRAAAGSVRPIRSSRSRWRRRPLPLWWNRPALVAARRAAAR